MIDIIVSADSHVMEPVDLWKKGVPEKYREAAPLFPPHKLGEGFQRREGGQDPNARIKEMEVDGLSAEVLYPTLLLSLYALEDAGLQEACFRLYNDWLIEYCSAARNRLIGIPAISIPCGFSPHGLPIGLSIAGRAHDDAKVLQLADAYERATEWGKRRPAVT